MIGSFNLRKKMSGFTLLELIITIAILAILSTIAIPSFRQMLANSRTKAFAESWVTAFNYAQKAAIKDRAVVQLCATKYGETCSGDAGNFSNGWIILGEKGKLKVFAPKTDKVTAVIDQSLAGSSGCTGAICFWRDGRLPASFSERYLYICDSLPPGEACNNDSKYLKYTVTIESTGRIQINKGKVI